MNMPPPRVSYAEIARLFLRISLSSFGGPAAHLALGEDEIVTRRGWLSREHYLDLIAATNLIPGPNSTEVMIHVGYVLRGIPGALVSGFCFIFPAFLLTLALSVVYVTTGTLPAIASILWGIQPAIIAIIAVAAYRLMPTALKTRLLWGMFVVSITALVLTDIPEVTVMLGIGALYALLQIRPTPSATALFGIAPALSQFTLAAQTVIEGARVGAFDLFFYFLRIGSVLFGSGYVLIAYIEQDLVANWGWLSARELLDAVAIGQFTPGPVLTTVTAVGYITAGFPGAIMATLGVFLPSFVLVILTAPLIPRMRQNRLLSAFLTGINSAVVAAILVTVLNLALQAVRPLSGAEGVDVTSILSIGLFGATLVGILRWKINATWLILFGATVGLIVGVLLPVSPV